MSFREGVDLVLDAANACKGSVVSLQVADVCPGVVDLYAIIETVVHAPPDYIELNIVI